MVQETHMEIKQRSMRNGIMLRSEKMTTDVDRIADASGIDKDKIMEIKNYIFMEKHELGGT